MQLKDEGTGELARSDAYKPQFRNLSTSSHNYLRISRILKCFGELGLENYPVRSFGWTYRGLTDLCSGCFHPLHPQSAIAAWRTRRFHTQAVSFRVLGPLQPTRRRAAGMLAPSLSIHS
jgi:hypothetical protein